MTATDTQFDGDLAKWVNNVVTQAQTASTDAPECPRIDELDKRATIHSRGQN